MAELEGRAVGFADLRDDGLLERLFVHPDAGGRRTARTLVSEGALRCSPMGRIEIQKPARRRSSMNDGTAVPPFRPTQAWWTDWPYEESTLVRVLAEITGQDSQRGIAGFLESLHSDPDADVADGVRTYWWGGFIAEHTPAGGDGVHRVLLASAGQDGFSSATGAVEDLAETLRESGGDVCLTWHELPAVLAT